MARNRYLLVQSRYYGAREYHNDSPNAFGIGRYDRKGIGNVLEACDRAVADRFSVYTINGQETEDVKRLNMNEQHAPPTPIGTRNDPKPLETERSKTVWLVLPGTVPQNASVE
jgi:hypothetical protein